MWHLTEKDRITYHVDTLGGLASAVDKNGNTTSLNYVGVTLTRVTEPADSRHLQRTLNVSLPLDFNIVTGSRAW